MTNEWRNPLVLSEVEWSCVTGALTRKDDGVHAKPGDFRQGLLLTRLAQSSSTMN